MTKALLPLITILAIAHIFALIALVGLLLFSSIVQEMGQGYVGVIIISLTFITLATNAALLFYARQKAKAQNFSIVKRLLFTAGGVFLAYNLIATVLNTAFLPNLLISSLVLIIAFVAVSRINKQENT